jgi:hypothetical protein
LGILEGRHPMAQVGPLRESRGPGVVHTDASFSWNCSLRKPFNRGGGQGLTAPACLGQSGTTWIKQLANESQK